MNEEEGKAKKTKAKKSIDILTILGLVFGLGLIVFGIVFTMPPGAEPVEADFVKGVYDPATGTATQEPDVEAYQAALEAYNIKVLTYTPINFGLVGGFIDIPSVAITIGGTFAALMVAYPLSIFAKFPKYVAISMMPNKYDPADYIAQIVDFAKEARIKGLLSLEDKLAEASDPFLKSSLMLVVDSVEPEKVHDLLQAELDKLDERHGVGRAFMDSGGAFAPGFGMIGTLIGLINMLGSLDDPSTIGPAMAVALLTTLYGSMLANLVFSPIGNKLSIRHNEEYLCRELICVGVEAIQAGENPKFIEEKLSLLVVAKKKKVKAPKGEAAAEG